MIYWPGRNELRLNHSTMRRLVRIGLMNDLKIYDPIRVIKVREVRSRRGGFVVVIEDQPKKQEPAK